MRRWPSEPSDTGESATRNLYAELLDAWNRHSADDFASGFADDAMLVAIDGYQVPGADLVEHMRLVFLEHPAAHCVGHVFQARPVGSGAVLLQALAGIVPAGETQVHPAWNTVHTLLTERRDGTWQIVLFQNAPAHYHGRPETADLHTTRLQQIIESDRR
ncbi:hypothetical protein NS14008_11940 [Nocardia seriolae]|nr:hypothetical protein NS14008_11940 [Nocardia seriolae]